jgi:hypothetical protein
MKCVAWIRFDSGWKPAAIRMSSDSSACSAGVVVVSSPWARNAAQRLVAIAGTGRRAEAP